VQANADKKNQCKDCQRNHCEAQIEEEAASYLPDCQDIVLCYRMLSDRGGGRWMAEQMTPFEAGRISSYEDHFAASSAIRLLFGQAPILFQNELERFFQISAGFRKGFPLCIYSGDFFNPGNIPAPLFLDNGCELGGHFTPFYHLIRLLGCSL
jgi:hypothetical protein